jgi:hypothetical protein
MKKILDSYNKYSVNLDIGGGDKGTVHSYLNTYEKFINKKENINLLEIGVFQGHSIKMWKDFFENSTIYGVDIDLSKVNFDLSDCIIFNSDATKESFLSDIENIEFDYIIDDGSHLFEHQIQSFDLLWNSLKKGGVYFIEDITPNSLTPLINSLEKRKISFYLYSGRGITNRYDDFMIIVEK